MSDSNDLKALVELANTQLEIENEIAAAEEHLKELKEKWEQVARNDIPDMMIELEVAKFTLEDGQTVQFERKVKMNQLSPEVHPEGWQWLIDHGHEDVMKDEVKVSFMKGEGEKAQQLVQELLAEGFETTTRARHIHPQTMGSLVRKLLKAGEPLDLSIFGSYEYNEAKITK